MAVLGKRKRRSVGPKKRMRMSYIRRVRKVKSRRRYPLRRSKARRWNRNKKMIPNVGTPKVRRQYQEFPYATIPHHDPRFVRLTRIGYSMTDDQQSRSTPCVHIRGFKINFNVRQGAGVTTDTEVRMAILVQKGPAYDPLTAALLKGGNPGDQYINVTSSFPGYQILNNSINSNLYSVIWSKKIKLGPALEASATSYQSNRSAQYSFSKYIKYHKNILYEGISNQDAMGNNVFFMYWCDDPMRGAGTPSTKGIDVIYDVTTYFNEP